MPAPWDGRLITYLGVGLKANRPPEPNVAPGLTALYFSVDDDSMGLWDSTATPTPDWVDYPRAQGLEELQDLVGAMVDSTTSIIMSYDDGGGKISGVIDPYWLATQLEEGANIELTADPVTGVITIGVTGDLGATELAQLDDVDVTTTPPANGQVLAWNTVDSKWKPANASGGGGGGGLPTVPPVIRGSSKATGTGSSVSINLPAGSEVGDLAFIFACCGHNIINISTPEAGWSWYGKVTSTAWNGTIFSKRLTSVDIAAGSILIPFEGAFRQNAMMVVFEGVTVTGVSFCHFEQYASNTRATTFNGGAVWRTPKLPKGSVYLHGLSTRTNTTMSSDGSTTLESDALSEGSMYLWVLTPSADEELLTPYTMTAAGSNINYLRLGVLGT